MGCYIPGNVIFLPCPYSQLTEEGLITVFEFISKLIEACDKCNLKLSTSDGFEIQETAQLRVSPLH